MFSLTDILFRDVCLAAEEFFLHPKPFLLSGFLTYFFDVWALFIIFIGKCAFSKNLLLNTIALFFIKNALKLRIAYFTVNE